jgi:hypothetical protein
MTSMHSYIVDFKWTCAAKDSDTWENRIMLGWHLAETTADDCDDMTKWKR